MAAIRIKPGDLLFYAGRHYVSRLIAFRTCSIAQLLSGQWFSHVGIVFKPFRNVNKLYVCESTTLNTVPDAITGRLVKGIQCHPLRESVQSYNGKVYHAGLNEWQTLDRKKEERLAEICKANLGLPYNKVSAMICGTEFVKHWHHVSPTDFCSDWCEWAERQIDVEIGNPERSFGSYSPAELARDTQNSGLFYRLRKVGMLSEYGDSMIE